MEHQTYRDIKDVLVDMLQEVAKEALEYTRYTETLKLGSSNENIFIFDPEKKVMNETVIDGTKIYTLDELIEFGLTKEYFFDLQKKYGNISVPYNFSGPPEVGTCAISFQLDKVNDIPVIDVSLIFPDVDGPKTILDCILPRDGGVRTYSDRLAGIRFTNNDKLIAYATRFYIGVPKPFVPYYDKILTFIYNVLGTNEQSEHALNVAEEIPADPFKLFNVRFKFIKDYNDEHFHEKTMCLVGRIIDKFRKLNLPEADVIISDDLYDNFDVSFCYGRLTPQHYSGLYELYLDILGTRGKIYRLSEAVPYDHWEEIITMLIYYPCTADFVIRHPVVEEADDDNSDENKIIVESKVYVKTEFNNNHYRLNFLRLIGDKPSFVRNSHSYYDEKYITIGLAR